MYNICCDNITIQYIFKTYYLQISNIKILYKYNILLNIKKKRFGRTISAHSAGLYLVYIIKTKVHFGNIWKHG